MFGRRRRENVPKSATSLGIGALVRVVNDGRGDEWDGEPIGLIVGAGSNQFVGYPGVGQSVSWMVAFESPAFTADGRGPFERISVPARQLVPLDADSAAAIDWSAPEFTDDDPDAAGGFGSGWGPMDPRR